MNKLSKEILTDYYYMGIELSNDNVDFPNWFEFYEEKMACLEGYNDQTLEVVKSKEELLKFVKELLD